MTKKRRNLIISIVGSVLVIGGYLYLTLHPKEPSLISSDKIKINELPSEASCSPEQAKITFDLDLQLQTSSHYDKLRCFPIVDGKEAGDFAETYYPTSPTRRELEQETSIEVPVEMSAKPHSLKFCCFKGKKKNLSDVQEGNCKQVDITTNELEKFCL